MKNHNDFLYDFFDDSLDLLLRSYSFYGGCRNSLAAVAVSQWFIETTLAGWVLASSVCA